MWNVIKRGSEYWNLSKHLTSMQEVYATLIHCISAFIFQQELTLKDQINRLMGKA